MTAWDICCESAELSSNSSKFSMPQRDARLDLITGRLLNDEFDSNHIRRVQSARQITAGADRLFITTATGRLSFVTIYWYLKWNGMGSFVYKTLSNIYDPARLSQPADRTCCCSFCRSVGVPSVLINSKTRDWTQLVTSRRRRRRRRRRRQVAAADFRSCLPCFHARHDRIAYEHSSAVNFYWAQRRHNKTQTGSIARLAAFELFSRFSRET